MQKVSLDSVLKITARPKVSLHGVRVEDNLFDARATRLVRAVLGQISQVNEKFYKKTTTKKQWKKEN